VKNAIETIIEEKIFNYEIKEYTVKFSTLKCRSIDDCEEVTEEISINEAIGMCKDYLKLCSYFVTINYPIYKDNIEVSISKDKSSIFGYEHFYDESELRALLQAVEYAGEQNDL